MTEFKNFNKDNNVEKPSNWGAEAILIDTEWLGLRAVKKIRTAKSYRIKELDEHLRRSRTIIEARLLHIAKEVGVRTPYIYEINLNKKTIIMERIDGIPVKDLLNNRNFEFNKKLTLVKKIGRLVGLLHNNHIIHGDLTTSNIIIKDDEIVFIDFGLGKISKDIEDKGVDFLLMKKCFVSTHTDHWKEFFYAFQEGYKETMKNALSIFRRALKIEARGRHLHEDQLINDYKYLHRH